MKATPHARSALGYFEELTPSQLSAFRSILLEIGESPQSFFTLEEMSYCGFYFAVTTESETLSSERDDISELDDFISALGNLWAQASITVYHGRKTRNLGLKLQGAHNGEQLTASFENENGIVQISALFRKGRDTDGYILRLANALNLSDKPKKASRHIPEALETKLLCDSMHLCNVCRETGVIIHHIVPVEDGGLAEEENLVVLCLNHHNQAHTKTILARTLRPEHLREYKRRHLAWVAAKGGTVALQPLN